MPLQLQPLEFSDFDTLISHASSHTPGDDLVAPPNPVAWPRRRFLRDPTTNFVKVVDTEDGGDIVAVARWHFYPHGYDYVAEAHWEMAPAAPLTEYLQQPQEEGESAKKSLGEPEEKRGDGDGDGGGDDAYPPPNFNLGLHNHILSARDSFPRGAGERRDCSSGWGMERARETGVDAYLEAGVQGRPVYEKFGFQQVGPERRVDLRDHVGAAAGVLTEFVLANMKWSPNRYLDDAPHICDLSSDPRSDG
ncbi:hypothetical protein G7054_g164 [Neopestalotiopsis clavispora]|nr:hypothetical protein G7054_g164 [Neopestalotiopsis clavispora]